MSSWRDVLRERQLAIDAADREELEEKRKCISLSKENLSDSSVGDVTRGIPMSSFNMEALLPAVQMSTEADLCESSERTTFSVPEMATSVIADSDGTENVQLSLPDDFTEELRSEADGKSLDGLEPEPLSSSVVGSPLHHQHQPDENSLPSVPSRLSSAEIENVLNCISDSSEVNAAGETLESFAEPLADLALDTKSPDHKRTRRHTRRKDGHASRKPRRTAAMVDTVPACVDVVGEQNQNEAEVDNHVSVRSHVLNSQLSQSALYVQPLSDDLQHLEVAPNTVVNTGDLSLQVVRQASYLKAIGVRSKNVLTSEQQNELVETAKPTAVVTALELIGESAKSGSKLDFDFFSYFIPRYIFPMSV